MDWASWCLTVTQSILGGLVLLWGVGGYYHIRYYVLRRHEPETWKIQSKRWLRPEQNRQAMRISTMNLMLGGLISGTFIHALQHGLRTPIYYDVADHGWAWTIFSSVLLFLAVDIMAYYAHRLLHVKPMFKRFHCWHHRYVATTPWVVTAMHPVEFMIFQASTFLPMFMFPCWAPAAVFVFVYTLIFNIIDHSGVRLTSRIPWQGPSMYHDDHHVHFHCNFGQHLTLWDRLHGTLRRTDRTYGIDVFGGKGKPAGRGKGEFVKY
jgi:Delta7-sterol 5-desaturase